MDWSKQRVFVTGHTGFKGAWLTQWLLELGATVTGFSLEPETNPALFTQLRLAESIQHTIGDIRDFETLSSAISTFEPSVIFHLAAQPLVRLSYHEPILTWSSNVQGTVHLLDSVRQLDAPCVVVAITTDKVYENREIDYAYKETDRFGGYDPYSASKAASEIVISSYRQSFFNVNSGIRLASARAGNVIGGGDWSLDRIVPDMMRALSKNETIQVRNPDAVRPWQHVLDPLAGYLCLAEHLSADDGFHDAYNFGPELTDQCTVRDLVNTALKTWHGDWKDTSTPNQLHEANLLSLDIDKAKRELGWSPVWDFNNSVEKTVQWYLNVKQGADPLEITRAQIAEFRK